MSMTFDEIEAEALKLSPEEREQVADALYISLPEAGAEIEPDALAEAQRRYVELRSGPVAGESLDDFIDYLRAPQR